MNWDLISSVVVLLLVICGAVWGFTRPRKPLSEKDRRDFGDSLEL